jgi:hypothetical protein
MARNLTRAQYVERAALIAEGLGNGLTIADLARMLGMHKESLREWIRAQEAGPRSQKFAREEPKVTTRRKCMRCDAQFDSEGFGNRLCGYCRQRAAEASPYMPDPGGSTGRQRQARRGE